MFFIFLGCSPVFSSELFPSPFTYSYKIEEVPHTVCKHKEIIGADQTHLQGYTGKGIKVGVIDTGVFDSSGFSNVAEIDAPIESAKIEEEDSSHPNHVVSTLKSIAPDCHILVSCYPLWSGQLDHQSYETQLAKTIIEMADHEVNFINVSLGFERTAVLRSSIIAYIFPKTVKDALRYARDKGIVVFMAGSNEGQVLGRSIYPNILPFLEEMNGHFYFVLASSYSQIYEQRASFSNVPENKELAKYCLTAPGEGILSLSIKGKEIVWEGTSAATPIVTGAAALLKQAYTDHSSQQILQRMVQSLRTTPLHKINITFEGFLASEAGRFHREMIEKAGSGHEWLRTQFRRAIIQRRIKDKSEKGFNTYKEQYIENLRQRALIEYNYGMKHCWEEVGAGILDIQAALKCMVPKGDVLG
ncbi:S8 family peptidase [Candidatus Paracaedibacter symbiosus]|uniref:S8 family peptidase n=1 Tax=Candidatus Paracaedibacter symbiosus TaxID=244582 RepID=UPI0005098B89|nr:S8 family serine peptidase [Candidatus Paracaedibacter symbiosus]